MTTRTFFQEFPCGCILASLEDVAGVDILACGMHKNRYMMEYGVTGQEMVIDNHRIKKALTSSAEFITADIS